MNLKTGYGGNVNVKCNDGSTIFGFYCIYTPALDNDNGIASISLETKSGLIEIFENEISEIKSI